MNTEVDIMESSEELNIESGNEENDKSEKVDEYIDMEVENSSEPVEVATIQQVELVDRPFMTTPFEDFSVIEGLLIVLVVGVWIYALVSVLKESFKWLK